MRRFVPAIVLAFVATASVVALLSAQAPPVQTAQAPIAFATDIQLILEKHCLSCDGDAMQMSKFDLRTREAAMAGGAHGLVIVPGSAQQSKLYRVVAGVEKPQMPMSGDSLSAEEVAKIKAWIDQGLLWETPVSFAKDIQPILSSTCLNCHGDTAQLSKFDLRTRDTALKGGEHGSDIVPGNAEQSRMYRRVAGLEKPSMPAQGAPLTAEQVTAVKKWINEGAKWEVMTSSAPTAASTASAMAALMARPITLEERNYWAFKLPVQNPPPVVANRDFINPID